MTGNEITIRSVQHYLYCQHRWGLLEIDRAWVENAFVTRANIMHERVHESGGSYNSRGRKIFNSVYVYNHDKKYNIYGKTDCIELVEVENGGNYCTNGKNYKLSIVEYKPSQPKNTDYNDDDLMQVFAQKICVDYVFNCKSDGYLYYADTKKRVLLPLQENFEAYNIKLLQVLSEMRQYLNLGLIPKISPKQKCNGCSMKDLCMPKIKTPKNLRNEIKDALTD